MNTLDPNSRGTRKLDNFGFQGLLDYYLTAVLVGWDADAARDELIERYNKSHEMGWDAGHAATISECARLVIAAQDIAEYMVGYEEIEELCATLQSLEIKTIPRLYRAIDKLMLIKNGWDGKGTLALDPGARLTAMGFITRMSCSFPSGTEICLTRDGGLNFEWTVGPRSLELELGEQLNQIHYLKWEKVLGEEGVEAATEENLLCIGNEQAIKELLLWVKGEKIND